MNSSYLSSRQSSFTSTDSSALKRIQKSRQLIDSNRPQSARTISSKSTQRANIKQTELVLNMSGPKPRSRPSSGASRLSSSDSIGKLSWISNQNSADWLSTSSINSNETITEYKRVSIKDFDFPLKSNGIQTTNHHHIYKMDEIKKTNDPFMIRAINEHPSPEKLDLNRRSLQTCPQLEDGEHIKLLDLQNNLIVKIDHLHHLRLLVFLDFYNNQIEEISGLDRLLSLRVLMLGRNKLSKIQGLESLVKLDILDLHSNRIKVIENLGNLFNLRVLNLEDNLITVVPSLIGCQALGELNLKKNKIWSFHGNGHLKKLYRLSLNDNKIALLCDIEEIFGLENLTELSMEQNKISENSFFKTFLVSKIPTLKLLDGRRILDETKRSAIRLAKKEESRRKVQEKKIGYIQEREKFINQIKTSWMEENKEEFQNSEIDEDMRIKDVSSKMMNGKTAYVELDGTTLHIYGNGVAALNRAEAHQAHLIHFDFVRIDLIIPSIPILSRLKSLVSLEFDTTEFTRLKQVQSLCHLYNLQSLHISDSNSVTKLPFFRDFAISVLPLGLTVLCQQSINPLEREQACSRFKSINFTRHLDLFKIPSEMNSMKSLMKESVVNLIANAVERHRTIERVIQWYDEMIKKI